MEISRKLRPLGWHVAAALLAVTLGAGSASAQLAFTPQNGFWADPNPASGRGMTIEVVPATGELFASMLVYDETGRAIWYVINTQPNSPNSVAMLQKFVGGQTLNSNFRAPTFVESVGNITFNFTSATTGSVTLPGGVMEIARKDLVLGGVGAGPSAGAPSGGWWYNAAESGRGFFIESQNGTLKFAAHEYNDLGQSTWYYSSGVMTSATLFTGALIEPYGGQTLSGANTQETQSYPRGTISIQFSSSTTATMTEPSGRQTAIVRYGF